MEWFHSTERDKQKRPQDSLASSHEIQSAFVEQRDYLHWIALLITGDHALADQAVINASDLSASYSSVFRDWLIGWTKYCNGAGGGKRSSRPHFRIGEPLYRFVLRAP